MKIEEEKKLGRKCVTRRWRGLVVAVHRRLKLVVHRALCSPNFMVSVLVDWNSWFHHCLLRHRGCIWGVVVGAFEGFWQLSWLRMRLEQWLLGGGKLGKWGYFMAFWQWWAIWHQKKCDFDGRIWWFMGVVYEGEQWSFELFVTETGSFSGAR